MALKPTHEKIAHGELRHCCELFYPFRGKMSRPVATPINNIDRVCSRDCLSDIHYIIISMFWRFQGTLRMRMTTTTNFVFAGFLDQQACSSLLRHQSEQSNQNGGPISSFPQWTMTKIKSNEAKCILFLIEPRFSSSMYFMQTSRLTVRQYYRNVLHK